MNETVSIKIREYAAYLKTNSLRNRMPAPFRLPANGTATFYTDEADPGVALNSYAISIETLCKGVTSVCVVGIVGNNRKLLPGVPPSWNVSKYDKQHKIAYWHVENTSVFITHRMIGRIRITYSQPEFENLTLNMEVFGIPTPHRSDSSSDGGVNTDDVPVSIPPPSEYPFYMLF